MKPVTKLWTQKNGTKIRICDISDKHLLNTISFLERKAEEQLHDIPFPSFNGEAAQYYAEQEFDNLMDMGVEDLAEELYPIYNDLIKEKDRRGL